MKVEIYEAREKLLKAANRVIGDRIDERAEDPGWEAEYNEDFLDEAARTYVLAKGLVEAEVDPPLAPGERAEFSENFE
jgi:hypothetical protein